MVRHAGRDCKGLVTGGIVFDAELGAVGPVTISIPH
jgi:hypothetical protein